MDTIPGYVSIVFILTTFASVAFILQASKSVGLDKLPCRILLFLLPLWIFFQTVLATGGFYLVTSSSPLRLLLFGVLPAILLIAFYFIFFRKSFIERLPLKLLTLLHIVRLPVEIVLYWLFVGGAVPQVMTFEGRNYDILSGILAPVVYLAAFRGGGKDRWLLIAYNILGLILLANIVTSVITSLPSPTQVMAPERPNLAVLNFPYIWLPAIVVPIVLFSHLTALWQLVKKPANSGV